MNDWPHHSTLELAALPDAPYWARRHTEDVLAKWDAEDLLTNAKLVMNELVTNAVRHTSTLDDEAMRLYAERPLSLSYSDLAGVGTVRLSLSHGSGRLLVEVWDKSPEAPSEQLPDFGSESGRGLFIVSAYCEGWGWYPAKGGGKVVWAELAGHG
jgi:anti-sigma regulatory factor (Ser/Thr protein kinase)